MMMMRVFLVGIGLLRIGSMAAQEEDSTMVRNIPVDTAIVYDLSQVSTAPRFPGGWMGEMGACFVGDPTDECNENTKVLVEFTAEVDGTVSNARALRPACKALSNAALCTLMNIATMKPATLNGVPVRCRMLLPIQFDLR